MCIICILGRHLIISLVIHFSDLGTFGYFLVLMCSYLSVHVEWISINIQMLQQCLDSGISGFNMQTQNFLDICVLKDDVRIYNSQGHSSYKLFRHQVSAGSLRSIKIYNLNWKYICHSFRGRIRQRLRKIFSALLYASGRINLVEKIGECTGVSLPENLRTYLFYV